MCHVLLLLPVLALPVLADVQGAPLSLGEEAVVVAIDGLRLTARRSDEAGSREQ